LTSTASVIIRSYPKWTCGRVYGGFWGSNNIND